MLERYVGIRIYSTKFYFDFDFAPQRSNEHKLYHNVLIAFHCGNRLNPTFKTEPRPTLQAVSSFSPLVSHFILFFSELKLVWLYFLYNIIYYVDWHKRFKPMFSVVYHSFTTLTPWLDAQSITPNYFSFWLRPY